MLFQRSSAVYFYRAYGQILASELPFPELRPSDPGPPAWTIRQGETAVRGADATGVVLGVESLYGDHTASLRTDGPGWRIVVDDTGEFELTADGREITIRPYADGSLDFLRAHLLGRVIATSLHASGRLVLHGSAVSYPQGAIAFLAPKHSGKSTLALKLTLAGARLVSDDSLPVTVEQEPAVWPGVHSLRLLGDSAQHVSGSLPSLQRPDGKYVLSDLPEERLESDPRPLKAIYLLVPAERIAEGGPVARRPLGVPAASAALVGQSKIPLMLGPASGPDLLRRAVQVASRVPVFQLMVLRDLNALDAVATQIAAWHGGVIA